MQELTNYNITLLAYLFILAPLMLLGFYFARRKMFTPYHKLTMTSVVVLNWIFILVVMGRSFGQNVAPSLPDSISDTSVLLPTIHLVTGAIAQLTATYLVLLMWTENTSLEKLIPFRIKRIKTPMRVTLTLWLITIILGAGIYGNWYGFGDAGAANAPSPATTEEAPAPGTTEEVSEPVTTEEAPEPGATEEISEPATTEEP